MRAYEYVIRSSHPIKAVHVAGPDGISTPTALVQIGPDLRPGKLGTQRYLAIRESREVDE